MSEIGRVVGSRSRRVVRRSVAAAVGAATVGGGPRDATAAQPNHQACLGEDIRIYVEGGSRFGGLVSGMAATGDGIGRRSRLISPVGFPTT